MAVFAFDRMTIRGTVLFSLLISGSVHLAFFLDGWGGDFFKLPFQTFRSTIFFFCKEKYKLIIGNTIGTIYLLFKLISTPTSPLHIFSLPLTYRWSWSRSQHPHIRSCWFQRQRIQRLPFWLVSSFNFWNINITIFFTTDWLTTRKRIEESERWGGCSGLLRYLRVKETTKKKRS